MSGTDFTQTANYGLYKPISNADINQWGSHLNANADTLDGLMHGFLPLAGGAPTGPIMITATGGSVARSAQDRAADVANVLDYGADPTGVGASTTAFQNALATGKNVWAPAGKYLITGQLALLSDSQSLRGDGRNTILQIDHTFDPTVTTGVIIVPSTVGNTPVVADMTIVFVQPLDLVKTATAISAVGALTVTLNNTTGISVGMIVVDRTARGGIPATVYFQTGTPTTVVSIAGNVVTLSANILSPGVTAGDSIQFATTRANFKTLAAGGSAGTAGQGIAYPWAIYAPGAQLHISNIRVEYAWNGIYIRSSAFNVNKIDMHAYAAGIDIDQCYNFPLLDNYCFYTWGEPVTGGPRDALTSVYYDGATIAANLGETDGACINNFQTFCGIVNLTANWSWGSFTNLMLDGTDANLNIFSTNGAGFAQITNCYSSKGVWNHGSPFQIATTASFRTFITNLYCTNPSNTYAGLLVNSGTVIIDQAYLWDGMQTSSQQMIEVFNTGVLYLSNTQLDASSGRTDAYINMSGTAALYMKDCHFIGTPGSGATAINAGANNPVAFDNVRWNGWLVNVPGNNANNGSTFVSPIDPSSMQAGSLSFDTLRSATQHFNTAFGWAAMNSVQDAANNNTAFGSGAGTNLTTGTGNTIVGATAGFNGPTSGSGNTLLGAIAGYGLTTGGNNILIGNYVDQGGLTTGSNNILIGVNMGIGAATSNSINIGSVFSVTGTNTPATSVTSIAGTATLPHLPTTTTYANDAAAATGGVAVGQLYRNGSAVQVRVT